MSKEKIEIAVSEGTKELVIREGAAIPHYDPRKVTINGVLGAPYQFLNSSKVQTFDPIKSHLLVDLEKKTLSLYLNEASATDIVIISGGLTMFTDLIAFGINREKKYSHKDLIRHLKKYKYYFTDPDEHRTFLGNLENFNARIVKTIKDAKEQTGNAVKSIEVVVDSAIKDTPTFKLTIPVYKGYAPVTFNVEIHIDATDGAVQFFLESQELFTLEKELAEKYIADEVGNFEKAFPLSVVYVG